MKKTAIKILALLFGILLLAIAVFAYASYLWIKSPIITDAENKFTAKQGEGIAQIAYRMQREGIISNAKNFLLLKNIFDKNAKWQSGEYILESNSSYATINSALKSGKVVNHKITFVEGLTNYQIIKILNNDDRLSGKVTQSPPEGFLFPSTYHFFRDHSRQDIIDSMNQNMIKIIQEVWETRPKNTTLKSPEELVALASVIEKESNDSDERLLVSSVFHNRLKKGMKLQSDITVAYFAGDYTGEDDASFLKSDIKIDNPYNTYYYKGLPVGAICNPSLDSLKAAMHPKDSDYLYFVADARGGAIFAKTFKEHLVNVEEYRRRVRLQKENKDKS